MKKKLENWLTRLAKARKSNHMWRQLGRSSQKNLKKKKEKRKSSLTKQYLSMIAREWPYGLQPCLNTQICIMSVKFNLKSNKFFEPHHSPINIYEFGRINLKVINWFHFWSTHGFVIWQKVCIIYWVMGWQCV